MKRFHVHFGVTLGRINALFYISYASFTRDAKCSIQSLLCQMELQRDFLKAVLMQGLLEKDEIDS